MSDSANVSHRSASQAIDEISTYTWQSIVKMQASEHTDPDCIFDPPGIQRQSHAYLLGYHHRIANKTYTVNAQDYWEPEIKTKNGDTYEIETPEEHTIDLDEHDSLTADTVPTQTEKFSLETLSDRWTMRQLRTVYTQSDSYGTGERVQEMKKLWLPPRAIVLAYEQLEDVRAKIGLAADIETPGWRSDEPLIHGKTEYEGWDDQ